MGVAQQTDLIGCLLAGRYRLLATMGAGASAQVFAADDLTLRRRVAVKVLHPALADDPTFLRRFQAEAQAAAALNHPNILAVYDWGINEGNGMPFLVSELLTGGSLRAVFDRMEVLTPSQTLLVGLEAARGLHYAHSRGFIHRDVKPANLLFGDDSRLRVADFGLARALAEAAWTEPEGVVLGTARYASPEQAVGAPLDGRTDVYSLALVLVECLTGTVPHAGDTALDTLRGRAGRPIAPLAEYGVLAPLLEAAGTADPTERWTAAQFGRALMNVAGQLSLPTPLVLSIAPSSVAHSVKDHVRPHTEWFPAERRAASADPTPSPTGPRVPAIGTDTEAPAVNAPGIGQESRSRKEQRAEARKVRRRRSARFVVGGLVAAALAVLGAIGISLAGGFTRTTTFVVADFSGQDALQTAAVLKAAPTAWHVTVVEDRRDGSVAGQIIGQDPSPQLRLAKGGAITLVRSAGGVLREVPAVEGLSEGDAENAIVADGLIVKERVRTASETVPSGRVVRSEPSRQQVEPGSGVALIVSSGPALRSVPNVTGKSSDKARDELAKLGLTVEAAEEYSESIDKGLVIRTEPPAEGSAERGSQVVIIVSKGRQPIVIPDFTGWTPSDAANKLEALGLNPSQDGLANRAVIATDPPAGETVSKGSSVRVISRKT